jgi:hypothetical protein
MRTVIYSGRERLNPKGSPNVYYGSRHKGNHERN